MRVSKATLIGAAVAMAAAPVWAADPAPERVVSLNVCTDQLAMLLADPAQLHSVSFLAKDPRVSSMVAEADQFVINFARAEEIFLMQPDLVFAGALTSRATVAMLQRFDIPVEILPHANSLEDVRDQILQVGAALGQEDRAQELLKDFDQRLSVLRAHSGENPSAALYFANGYTNGDATLAGQILLAAGFDNIARDVGYSVGGVLPLELLALSEPDTVVVAQKYPGHSRSEAVLEHQVVQDLRAAASTGSVSDRDWICGTPFVLRAIEALGASRAEIMEIAP